MNSKSYLIVGHGGQGVLDLGNFIAYDAILHGQKVAYTPSYGPETRGGKVRCYVIRSEEEIDSPIVDEPDMLVAMNNPSMDFETIVKPKGTLLMNTSLIDRPPMRNDLQTIKIPATEIADQMKGEVKEIADSRVLQNAVMYGAILAEENESLDVVRTEQTLEHVYSGSKSRYVAANLKATLRGDGYVRAAGLLCRTWGT